MRALSRTVSGIERSPIRFIFDRATHYTDVIHLEIGQPDFPTPTHVIEAAVEAARNEYTGYTANAGMIELREAVVTKLQRENGLQVRPENIMVTIGAMEAIYASMAIVLDPGDEILLPDPGYGNFYMAAEVCHGIPIAYPTLAKRNFEPDFQALEALVTDRTRAILVCSPSNPTGAVYSEQVLRSLLDFCRRHDLYMISDETYDQLVFKGQHHSPAKWDNEGRVISVFSVSKTYSMTGWRVGYAVSSEEIIGALSKIQEPIVSCVNTIAQHAAIAALLGPQDSAREMLAHYGRRRDLAVQVAQEQGLVTSEPHGAFYMLVDISGQPKSSFDFCLDLLDVEQVAVAPGCSFGSLCEDYVRISLCASDENLAQGISRLARYLRSVSTAARASEEGCVGSPEPLLEKV